jgi:hypothetical protein
MPGRAWQKYIPDICFNFSIDDIRTVITGLIDTDGHESNRQGRKRSTTYTTTSPRLASTLCELLKAISVVAGISPSKSSTGGTINGRTVQGKHKRYNIIFSTNEYEGNNAGTNGRRSHFYKDFTGLPVQIKSIEEEQTKYVYDFSVDDTKWQTFVANGILVHNTATPYRSDRVKLCFDKVIKDAGIHALIEQGYLSPYHQYIIPSWDVESVTAHYLRDPEKWGKSVFFWRTREEANLCNQMLHDAGIATDLVVSDGDPKQERREAQLAAFEKGELQALVNMFILTEGFDCKSLKTAWVRDSGKLPSVQMCGRVFRKCDGIPFKQVVQSKMTRWPIQRTAKPARSHVWKDEQWASYDGKSKRVEQVTRTILPVLARIETHMPTYILNRQKHKQRINQNTESGLPPRS